MASIEKRVTKDGRARWTARVYVGRDPTTGKKKFQVSTHDRKKDAEAEARRLERMKDLGSLVLPSKEPLTGFLRRWLDDHKEGKVRARTLYEYRGVLDRYVFDPPDGAPPIGAIPLHRLRPEAFSGLYAFLWKDRGLAPRTIQYLHTVMKQALGWAVRTRVLAVNPLAEVSPATQRRDEGGGTVAKPKTVRSMEEDEAGRFLEAAREDRYYALWAVLLTGGLRPSEALALGWDAVDFEKSRVHVTRSLTRVGVEGWKLVEPKTDASRRAVVLPGVAIDALREWKATQGRERLRVGTEWAGHDAGFVFTTPFGEPLDGSNLLHRNFRSIMERAGLGVPEVRENGEWVPETEAEDPEAARRRRFNPSFRMYDLRHTCATLLLKRGVGAKIVQERLGHASITLTLDTYAHVLPTMQGEAADELEAVFG